MFAYLTAAFSYLDRLLAQRMHAPLRPDLGACLDQTKGNGITWDVRQAAQVWIQILSSTGIIVSNQSVSDRNSSSKSWSPGFQSQYPMKNIKLDPARAIAEFFVQTENSFCLWNLIQILHNLLSTSDLSTQSRRSAWLQSNYRHNSNRITAWKLQKVRSGAQPWIRPST